MMNEITKKKLLLILKELIKHPGSALFREPPDVHELPGYSEIVKDIQDLGTIRSRVQKGYYKNVERCLKDIQTVWANAKAYNHQSKEVVHLVELNEKFMKKLISKYLPSSIDDITKRIVVLQKKLDHALSKLYTPEHQKLSKLSQLAVEEIPKMKIAKKLMIFFKDCTDENLLLECFGVICQIDQWKEKLGSNVTVDLANHSSFALKSVALFIEKKTKTKIL